MRHMTFGTATLLAVSLAVLTLGATAPGCDSTPPVPASSASTPLALRPASPAVAATPPTPDDATLRQQAQQAARAQLPAMLARIPASHLVDWGFASDDERQRAEAGWPLPMYLGALTTTRTEIPADAAVYRVPVLVDGRAVCLLTMSQTPDGQWTASDLGAAEMATLYQQAGAPQDLALVRFLGEKTDFFMFDSPAGPRFRLLDVSAPAAAQSGGSAHVDARSDLLSLDEVDALLRDRAQRMSPPPPQSHPGGAP